MPGSSSDRVLNSYNAPVFVSQSAEQTAAEAAAAEAAAAEAEAIEQAAADRSYNTYFPPRTSAQYPGVEFSNFATNIPGLSNEDRDPDRK